MSFERADNELSQGDLKDAYPKLLSAQDKWRDIGLQLGIDTSDLKQIASNNPQTKDQLREMLDMRIKQGGLTWEKIVEALENVTVSENVLAGMIKNKYIKPQSSTSSNIAPPTPTRERHFSGESSSSSAQLPPIMAPTEIPERSSYCSTIVGNDPPNETSKLKSSANKHGPSLDKRKDSADMVAPRPLLGKRKDSRDNNKMAAPKEKRPKTKPGPSQQACYSQEKPKLSSSSKKPGLSLGKTKDSTDNSKMAAQKEKQPKTEPGQSQQACYSQEIINLFVQKSSLGKYRCMHCGGVPKACYRSKCDLESKGNTGLSCSNCKTKPCTSCGEVDYEQDKAAFSNIRKLLVYCPNKANGCEEKPTLAGLEKHKEVCPKKKTDCVYNEIGCTVKPLREVKDEHEEDMKVHSKLIVQAITDLNKRLDSIDSKKAK